MQPCTKNGMGTAHRLRLSSQEVEGQISAQRRSLRRPNFIRKSNEGRFHNREITATNHKLPLLPHDAIELMAGSEAYFIGQWPQPLIFLVAAFDLIETPSRIDLFRTPSSVRSIAFAICSRVFPDPASSDRRRSSL